MDLTIKSECWIYGNDIFLMQNNRAFESAALLYIIISLVTHYARPLDDRFTI